MDMDGNDLANLTIFSNKVVFTQDLLISKNMNNFTEQEFQVYVPAKLEIDNVNFECRFLISRKTLDNYGYMIYTINKPNSSLLYLTKLGYPVEYFNLEIMDKHLYSIEDKELMGDQLINFIGFILDDHFYYREDKIINMNEES